MLFTFLDRYMYAFTIPYGTSQGQKNLMFIAMYVGVLLSIPLVPLVHAWTKSDMEKHEGEKAGAVTVHPETRLWYAMLGGSWAVPISLFWMGWTNFVSLHHPSLGFMFVDRPTLSHRYPSGHPFGVYALRLRPDQHLHDILHVCD